MLVFRLRFGITSHLPPHWCGACRGAGGRWPPFPSVGRGVPSTADRRAAVGIAGKHLLGAQLAHGGVYSDTLLQQMRVGVRLLVNREEILDARQRQRCGFVS